MTLPRSSLLLVCVLAFGSWLGACASDQEDPSGPSDEAGAGSHEGGGAAGGTTAPPSCATPAEGCPCVSPGDRVDCGQVENRTGDYVSCSKGTRSCGADGKWGSCQGDRLAPVPPAPQYFPQGIGSSGPCPDNPCDPYCRRYTDDGTNLDPGPDNPGVTTQAGAVVITPTEVASSDSLCTGITVTVKGTNPPVGSVKVVAAPAPPKVLPGGLKGYYFPYWDTTQLDPNWQYTGTRVDPQIDFDWSAAGPGVTGIGQSNYSVRWVGKVTAPVTGHYVFETSTDDAARLWVDNQLIVDAWYQQGETAYDGHIDLTAGQSYDIRMEYNQGGGGAVARLRWAAVSDVPVTTMDVAGGLQGDYFNSFDSSSTDPNPVPTSPVTGSRVDGPIQFDWSAAGPGVSGIGQSLYSVRWTGKVRADVAGSYRFQTQTDDAVRLWIDGNLVIDKWLQQGTTAYQTASINLSVGLHTVKMEYNQGGGGAYAELDWRRPGDGGYSPIPADHLYNHGGGQVQSIVKQTIPSSALSYLSDAGNFAFTPSPVQFQAALSPPGCYSGEFKPAWTVDKGDIATIDDDGVVTLFGAKAGPIQVTAYGGSLTGQGAVDLTIDYVDASGAPPGVTDANFQTPGTVIDPVRVLYPYDHVVYPLALAAPVLQWDNGGLPASAVKVTLRYPSSGTPVFSYGFIASEGAKPRMTFPQSVWSVLDQSAKGQEIAIDVQRLVAGVPLATVTRKLLFSNAELRGRIYYTQYDQSSFTASEMYIDPSGPHAPTPMFPSGSGCPVCHTVASGGTRFVTSSNWGDAVSSAVSTINPDGSMTHVGDAVQTSPYTDNAADYRGLAWAPITPDGNYVIAASNFWGNTNGGSVSNSSNGDNGSGGLYYVWRVPGSSGPMVDVTGQSTNRWGLGNAVMMVPSFSPDGKHLVFLNGDSAGHVTGWRKGLSTWDFDETAKTFTNRRLAVNNWPNGWVMKWPTFESDSRSVIYQTSDRYDSSSYAGYYEEYGNMAPTNKGTVPGRFWSVDTQAASPNPVPLDTLNKGEQAMDANKSYQATMLPKQAGGYRWAVFTSTRPYGNTLNTVAEGNQRDYSNPDAYVPVPNAVLQSQLWVGAIDDQTSAASDRSHPGFWLPNQNPRINERGFWVLDPCVPTGSGAANVCSTTEQCCGGDTGTAVCRLDLPVDPNAPTRHCAHLAGPGACGLVGDACGSTADCCVGLLCDGGTGKCEPPPPVKIFTPANYTREPDYDGAVCPDGTHAVWRLLQWEATTPGDSRIEFYVQTADDPSSFVAVPVAPNGVPSSVVAAGVASGAPATVWTSQSDGKTVDDDLVAHGLMSLRYLRVTARLVPTSDKVQTPSLQDWRVNYSCLPSE